MSAISPKRFLAIAILVGLVAGGIWLARSQKGNQLAEKTAPVPAVAAEIPSVLQNLTDHAQPWQWRIDQLRSELAITRSESELLYLYQILGKPTPDAELPQTWYLIANEIMIELGKHDAQAQRFTSQMLTLAQDESKPLVIRDYAVQHLITYVHTRWANASSSDRASSENFSSLLNACAALAVDPKLQKTSIPGTTLMMLMGLAQLPQASKGCSAAIMTLKPWLSSVFAEGSMTSEPVRVSALKAAAMFAPDEFRDVIRSHAFGESMPLALQLPAIAALARCGQAQDVPKLQQLADQIPALHFAALKASQSLIAQQKTTPSP